MDHLSFVSPLTLVLVGHPFRVCRSSESSMTASETASVVLLSVLHLAY